MRTSNDEFVLQSFYQERQARSRTPKTHSLLQKNMSFFSTNPTPLHDENIPPPSSKYAQRKTNLQQYERNFRALTTITPSLNTESRNTQKSIDERQIMQQLEEKYSTKYSCTLARNSLLTGEGTFRGTHELVESRESKFTNSRAEQNNVSQEQFYSSRAEDDIQYSSPNFKANFESVNSPDNLMKLDSPAFTKGNLREHKQPECDNQQSQTELRLMEQVRELRERLEQLETEKRKQEKFVESVRKMRRAVEKKDEDCSLKQLWRWVKSLPMRP